VTKTAGGVGTFDPRTGTMTMPITLHFDHSLDDLIVGDSDVKFALTTGSSASPSGTFKPVGIPVNRTTGFVGRLGPRCRRKA